jgi:hypothetical protein
MELVKVDATYVSSDKEESTRTHVRNKCQLPTVGYGDSNDRHDVNPASTFTCACTACALDLVAGGFSPFLRRGRLTAV